MPVLLAIVSAITQILANFSPTIIRDVSSAASIDLVACSETL